jgi:hypothetical protein
MVMMIMMMMMMMMIQGKGIFRQSEYPTFCNIAAVTGRESCNNRYVMESFF